MIRDSSFIIHRYEHMNRLSRKDFSNTKRQVKLKPARLSFFSAKFILYCPESVADLQQAGIYTDTFIICHFKISDLRLVPREYTYFSITLRSRYFICHYILHYIYHSTSEEHLYFYSSHHVKVILDPFESPTEFQCWVVEEGSRFCKSYFVPLNLHSHKKKNGCMLMCGPTQWQAVSGYSFSVIHQLSSLIIVSLCVTKTSTSALKFYEWKS